MNAVLHPLVTLGLVWLAVAVLVVVWFALGRWGTPDDHEIGDPDWPTLADEPLPPEWVNDGEGRL